MIYGANIIQSSYIFHEFNKSHQDRVLQAQYFTLPANLLHTSAEETPHPPWLASRKSNPRQCGSQEAAGDGHGQCPRLALWVTVSKKASEEPACKELSCCCSSSGTGIRVINYHLSIILDFLFKAQQLFQPFLPQPSGSTAATEMSGPSQHWHLAFSTAGQEQWIHKGIPQKWFPGG